VICLLCIVGASLDRQPNADYKARRQALAKKVGGIVILFAPLEPTESRFTFGQDEDI
jgi:hypothetical protein